MLILLFLINSLLSPSGSILEVHPNPNQGSFEFIEIKTPLNPKGWSLEIGKNRFPLDSLQPNQICLLTSDSLPDQKIIPACHYSLKTWTKLSNNGGSLFLFNQSQKFKYTWPKTAKGMSIQYTDRIGHFVLPSPGEHYENSLTSHSLAYSLMDSNLLLEWFCNDLCELWLIDEIKGEKSKLESEKTGFHWKQIPLKQLQKGPFLLELKSNANTSSFPLFIP